MKKPVDAVEVIPQADGEPVVRLHFGNVDNADPQCEECFGNGFRWNGLTCWCCDRQEEEVNEQE